MGIKGGLWGKVHDAPNAQWVHHFGLDGKESVVAIDGFVWLHQLCAVFAADVLLVCKRTLLPFLEFRFFCTLILYVCFNFQQSDHSSVVGQFMTRIWQMSMACVQCIVVLDPIGRTGDGDGAKEGENGKKKGPRLGSHGWIWNGII